MFVHAILPKVPDGRLTRSFWLGAALVLVSGCAATRPSIDLPDISTWEQRQAVLGSISDWEFKGRIAVKTGDDGFNGKFDWTQTGDDFSATVGGPLGIGTVRIEGDNDVIQLTDKDGEQTVLVDPEAELFYRYGWTIPVASLRFWALGIPDPSLPAETGFDSTGRLIRIGQSGWEVRISRYRDEAGQQMPRTLTATNPDTRVRMVIDRWKFFER